METDMYASYTDEQLLLQMNEDENAFNELYRRYYRLVYYIAFKLCRNDADAKDVLQETFIRVKQSAYQIKDPSKFKAWLSMVTTSRCKDMFKHNRHQLYDSDFDIKVSMNAEDRIYMLPEAQMHYDSDEMLLSTFITRLPDAQQEVIVMKFFEQKSIHEIAALLDISEGTVKSRIFYGKNLLHGMLDDHNRKNPEHILDFKMLDVLTPASLALLLLPRKALTKVKTFALANPLVAASVAVTTMSVSGVGLYNYAKAHNEASNPIVQNVNTSVIENESRKLYFKLMDWAACKSDMEVKTQAEYEQILPLYQKLKANDDEYLNLLKKMNWDSNFIEVFSK